MRKKLFLSVNNVNLNLIVKVSSLFTFGGETSIKARKKPNYIVLDMATQNVCRFFKFGFCKYTVKCRFLHVKENCENQECDVISCNLRHPRICSFYRDYDSCKFGEWCCFRHVHKSVQSDREVINRIENLELKKKMLKLPT